MAILPPDKYLGQLVPDEIKERWLTWEAASWRANQHMGQGNLYPPDQRFTVRPPEKLCPIHLEIWRGYRDMRFNPYSGNRWPGHPGSPFIVVGSDMNRVREERRVEWDRKSAEQMRLTEEICLSGQSPQCGPLPADTTPVDL